MLNRSTYSVLGIMIITLLLSFKSDYLIIYLAACSIPIDVIFWMNKQFPDPELHLFWQDVTKHSAYVKLD